MPIFTAYQTCKYIDYVYYIDDRLTNILLQIYCLSFFTNYLSAVAI